jgi:DNA repair exonuclease SbcCD nuclease subunit
MRFEFLHAADIHLDSPLRGLSRYEGAPVEAIRGATRRALENLVSLAIERKVAFVLIAGDLYDGDWDNCNTGFFFAAQMARLKSVGIPVVLISGNHDAASHMSRSLPVPDAVRVLSTSEPETVRLDDYRVAIHGQGFATREVRHDLSASYPRATTSWFNIGLLHTCAQGAEGHESYAPCSIEGLRSKGYQYWALGHVHAPAVLSRDPWIVFPGNVQGRHIREPGTKGCSLVTVSDGEVESVKPIALDVLRWQRCVVRADAAATLDDVLECAMNELGPLVNARDDRALAVRVEIEGACPVHGKLVARQASWEDDLRARAIDLGEGSLWIERVRFGTRPPRQARSQDQVDGPLATLETVIEAYQSNPESREALLVYLKDLQRKLPPELHQGEDPRPWEELKDLSPMLDEVRELLKGRLLE